MRYYTNAVLTIQKQSSLVCGRAIRAFSLTLYSSDRRQRKQQLQISHLTKSLATS